MKSKTGLHFYINIRNFNDIVEAEDNQGGVNHSIHALDTLFSLTEQYGMTNYPETFVVEKITGSRLHMFVTGEIDQAFETAATIILYSLRISELMSSDIAKYKSIEPFILQAGAAYGKFYEYDFIAADYEEMTTIGYACNYAAKLQGLAESYSIAVSENIYNAMSFEEKSVFTKKHNSVIHKYKQTCYYEALMSRMISRIELSDTQVRGIREYANKRNLTDMSFSEVKQSLNMERLSVTSGRRINGIPVFADVRDFTSEFLPDDSNLNEMAQKTKQILEKLYAITVNQGGVHVQFQGDREFALYHNVGDKKCYKDAVLGAMRMIDAVKPYSVHIGVGEAFGRMYAVRIGARGEKDRLLIGRTVNKADYLEDEIAEKDQLAISKDVYEGLKLQDAELAKLFRRTGEDIYVTTMGFEAYKNQKTYAKQERETKNRQYNGAYGVANER